MNKRDLVEYVRRELETTRSAAEDIVQVVCQGIREGLAEDGEVTLPGFGAWSVRERAPRTLKHPSNGETIQLPASSVIVFRAARAWRETVGSRA